MTEDREQRKVPLSPEVEEPQQTAVSPCPGLPVPGGVLRAAAMRAVGADRGSPFYRLALECAQSLWLQRLPAQAVLLLNRAMGADLKGSEKILERWPIPYQAVAWILAQAPADAFTGNPRRHYQHLATRMVEPRRETRVWRAWACWALSRRICPDLPADEKQLAEESLREPSLEEIGEALERVGLPGERSLWEAALEGGGTP